MNPENLNERELMKRVNFGSRDNSRRPMPWSDAENGGFGGRPWLPVHDRYKDINAEADMNSDRSVFKFFRELIALRTNNEAFTDGSWENLTGNRSGVYIYRRYTDKESYIVVCNFENESLFDTDCHCECILSNMGKREINGAYAPYECAVYKCIG